MEEIGFSQWLFEGRLRQGKNVLPDGLNWLCYFVGSSKSHHENSISFIFLKSPHQVDMKNVAQFFWGYFNTLETHSALDFPYHSLRVSIEILAPRNFQVFLCLKAFLLPFLLNGHGTIFQ